MRATSVFAIILLLAAAAMADDGIRGKTEDGRGVILNDDGTWRYTGENPGETPAPAEGDFTKPAAATTEIKGKKGFYSQWIIPEKWSLMDRTLNQAAEYCFMHTGSEAYAMIIFERTRIPMETLQQIVLQNAKAAAPDARITRSENRTVNGQAMRFIAIEGTVSGIPFVYNYYLYSGKFSMQIITFTSLDLYGEYQNDFMDFLNGVTLNP